MPETNGNVWKGLVAGLAGGIAGTWVMTQFQTLAAKTMPQNGQAKQSEPATVKAARAVKENVLDEPLRDEEKPVAGNIVHYAMGAVSGGIYGTVSQVLPLATAGYGTLFGAAVWVAADLLAVPALGLSEPPAQTPLPAHAQYLAAHLVYGTATDLFRRAILKLES